MPHNQVSLHVDAAPERCWELVSDITNMGRWSPECRRTAWVVGDRPEAGNRFRGWNRRGPLRWSTVSTIEIAEPPHRLAFTVELLGRRLTTWEYRFEADGRGTRIVELRTSLALFRPFQVIERLAMRGRRNDYAAAMGETLDRIREAAESSTSG